MFRMVSYRGDTDFMKDEGLDPESIGELTDLLQSCGALDSLDELCELLFAQNRDCSRVGFPLADSRTVHSPCSIAPWNGKRRLLRCDTGSAQTSVVSRKANEWLCISAFAATSRDPPKISGPRKVSGLG